MRIVSRKIIVFQTLIILLLSNSLYGIDLNFKRYSVEDGLSSNVVLDLLQDSEGYMWVATENGLDRFNAYEFVSYRKTPRDSTSLISNYVYTLYEDSNKNLWIGTQTGISIYSLDKKTFNPFSVKTNEGVVINERISNILSDKDNQLWISASKQGIFCYSNQGTLKGYDFNEYKLKKSDAIWVTCIYIDSDNNIWASVNNTQHQVYKFDKNNDRFIPAFPKQEIEIIKKLSSYAITEDSLGSLWFGTWTNGLFAIDKKNGAIGQYLNTGSEKILHIHSLVEYEPGLLLIGSDDGLTLFNVSSTLGNKMEVHITEPVLSSRFVYPIYKDREGGLWIGTYYGGINYSSPNRNYFSSYVHSKYENSIGGNIISVFCEDTHGNIWIGTDDGGLSCFDEKTGHFTVYNPNKTSNSLSYHNVHSLCVDGDDLWIGTYQGGLNVMNLKTKKFKYYYTNPLDSTSIYSNSIYSLFKDSRGDIWIGTVYGINRYNRPNDSFDRVLELDEFIFDIEEFDNKIWFAANGRGIYTYDLEKQQWCSYTFDPNNYSSLISNDAVCFCIDGNNDLWVGTNNGLCKYNKDNDCFIANNGAFENTAIYKIFSDGDYLWVATINGLIQYNIATQKTRIFTKGDGLLSEQFTPNAGLKASSGRIYIGTTNGFSSFYPKQITENRHIPQVGITDFQLFNQSVNINDYISTASNGVRTLTLSHKQNAFSFEYTALSYFDPEKNEYAYTLQGFDKKWNNIGKLRKATYTNVPPGEYYFKVKASNNDGIWNDEGLAIRIVITPPFWWNKIAITVYTLIISLILISLIIYWDKRAKRRNIDKLEKMKAEQEKEMYNSKIEFFTNIAHEIRTPVSLIIGPLEQIVSNSEILPENVVEDLNIINRNGQRLLSLVNQILDFRKIEKETFKITLSIQNIYELLRNVYDRFKPSVEHKRIKFIYTYDSKDFHTAIDAENITKVISNLLNNASKYTKDYIELRLTTNTGSDNFEICVIDNGPGIPEEEQENVFKPFYQISGNHKSGTGIGLYLVKSVVDASKGTITLKSDPDKGLSFSVLLPIINNDGVANVSEEKSNEADQCCCEENLLAINNSDFKIHTNNKQTLLIAEDNTDMQLFLQKNLADQYYILLADNGKDGIKLLEKNEVDIIISDIMMPEMDGIEFCNIVKNSSLWNHIPFLLLTAKTNIASKIEGLEIGADAYIEKPFSVPHLSAQIKNLLDSRRNLLKKFTESPHISLKSIAGNKAEEEFLSKLNEILERNITNAEFSIENLAEEMCISTSSLFAKIKNVSNVTPNKLLLLFRLKKATELLAENKYRINEISYMVGFNNPSYFAKCFQKQYGVLPKDFRGTLTDKQNIDN